jgi:DNA-directed RNA polymerase sigma subunit (sigma70/sigma32)
VVFRTTSAIRRYHDTDCQAAAARSREAASAKWKDGRSPARRAREEASLRAEAAVAAAEWSDAATDRSRASVWSVASIDQPIGEDGASLHEVLPAPDQDGDPAAELERETARELLEGVTEEAIAAMDDAELAELRARLVAADVQPSTFRAVVA